MQLLLRAAWIPVPAVYISAYKTLSLNWRDQVRRYTDIEAQEEKGLELAPTPTGFLTGMNFGARI